MPKHARGFISLLPLSEIIATVLAVGSLYSQKVWTIYNKLIEEFHNEYAVLMDVPLDLLGKVVDEKIAQAIIRVRNELMMVIPGYDGEYGKIVLNEDILKNTRKKVGQSTLREFC